MRQSELISLAYQIADDASQALIECHTLSVTRGGAAWHDLASMSPDEIGKEAVDEAVTYLTARGILEHHPEDEQLVRWEGVA